MQKHLRSAVFAVALAAMAVIMIVATWAPGSARAQQQPQGVERKILMRQDLSMPGWESVMIQTTMQPGATEGWHTHPGTLVEYILQGPWTMELRGKPTATYQTGETFSIVEGQVHQAINPGKHRRPRLGHTYRRQEQADDDPGAVAQLSVPCGAWRS